MKCLCTGYHHIHDKNFVTDRPNGSGDWLLLIVKTPAVFYIEGKEIHTQAGTFIIFPLHAPLHYTADGQEYIDDWLHFFPDEEDLRLFEELNLPLNTPVEINDVSAASAIMRNMCFEFYSAHQNKNEIVSLYLRIMLYKINEQEKFHYSDTYLTETKYMHNLLWIRESIFRWPEQDWNVDFFADELGVSRSRFQHLYVTAFGSTMMQDIIDARIQRSCELLRNTDEKIESIAESCGYSSVSYFVQLFKEKIEVTPAVYRNNYKKNGSV